jgi:hypothetical protein
VEPNICIVIYPASQKDMEHLLKLIIKIKIQRNKTRNLNLNGIRIQCGSGHPGTQRKKGNMGNCVMFHYQNRRERLSVLQGEGKYL